MPVQEDPLDVLAQALADAEEHARLVDLHEARVRQALETIRETKAELYSLLRLSRHSPPPVPETSSTEKYESIKVCMEFDYLKLDVIPDPEDVPEPIVVKPIPIDISGTPTVIPHIPEKTWHWETWSTITDKKTAAFVAWNPWIRVLRELFN